MNIKNSESGQAVLLMALALIGLMAFTALAIDGGMVLSDRRFDQNAADASALAGAGVIAQRMELETDPIYSETFTCGSWYSSTAKASAETAAVNRATANHFTIAAVNADVPGVKINCTAGGTPETNYVDVQVIIESTVQTSFAHLIFGGEMKNTIKSTVRVSPGRTMAFGAAIASLSPNCGKPSGANFNASDGGIIFDGSNDTRVYGGGIYSRSCLYPNGQPTVQTVNPADHPIVYETIIEGSTKGTTNFSPSPTKPGPMLDPWILPAPPCDGPGMTDRGFVSQNNAGHALTISPGRYSANGNKPAIEVKKGKIIMEPGLYCVNGDISVAAQGTLEVEGFVSPPPSVGGEVTHDGITIYITNGDFNNSAGGVVRLWAAFNVAPSVNATQGMLLYMPPNASNDYTSPDFDHMIDLGGNPDAMFEGTVYAPYNYINFGGTPNTTSEYSTELIGYVIRLDGTASISIHYDSKQSFHSRASISQLK